MIFTFPRVCEPQLCLHDRLWSPVQRSMQVYYGRHVPIFFQHAVFAKKLEISSLLLFCSKCEPILFSLVFFTRTLFRWLLNSIVWLEKFLYTSRAGIIFIFIVFHNIYNISKKVVVLFMHTPHFMN